MNEKTIGQTSKERMNLKEYSKPANDKPTRDCIISRCRNKDNDIYKTFGEKNN